MNSDYWSRIAQTVARFAQSDDNLRCIRIRKLKNPSSCELCGHEPIFWVHTLQNSRTKETLEVGSECINNYVKIHKKRFGNEITIFYPSKYAKAANFLNQKYSRIITIVPSNFRLRNCCR